MFEAIRGEGYAGSYGRVSAFVRRWHEEQAAAPRGKACVPLAFESGEAFQFDRSCEYAVIGGLRRRLEVAHVKLNSRRAFWLVAYPTQSHEMLFDAHARAFAAFGGVPRRAIYDNMKKRLVVGRGRRDELVGVRPAPRAVSINFHGPALTIGVGAGTGQLVGCNPGRGAGLERVQSPVVVHERRSPVGIKMRCHPRVPHGVHGACCGQFRALAAGFAGCPTRGRVGQMSGHILPDVASQLHVAQAFAHRPHAPVAPPRRKSRRPGHRDSG
ncbi:integrase [Burkholderia plantarii]|uniref:Integrase n=1 Tax=Burkholderia plantarii TaxID=41899 RepID=A0A0B6RKY6_BURPL|nr:integrase [Burkholderia plantarii]